MRTNITVQMLQRLPQYLSYLKALPKEYNTTISATAIAEALSLNDVQVRKDLAAISDGGKPKIGYITDSLIKRLEKVLGYDDVNDAIVVGVGNLGRTLMSYVGFSEYGLNIVAGFDIDKNVINTEVSGKKVLSVKKLKNLCQRMKIHIGIITVPASEAQKVCDALTETGVMGIWNFAPIHLKVPDGVHVQNEDMATSLAILSRHITENLLA